MAFKRVRKIPKSDYYLRHVCSHSKHFHEIWYLSIFGKCQENLSFIKI